jgi:hypothetical protein
VKPVPGARYLPAVALAVALTGAIGGCGPDPAALPGTDGPLGPPQNNVTQCAPAQRAGHPITIGLLGVQNTGSQPLVIDRVTLAKPGKGAGLALAGWGVIPGSNELGVYLYWPLRGHGLTVADRWRLDPRQWVDIVVGVTAEGRGGYTPGAQVYYHAGSARYVYRSTVAMRVVVMGRARCS